MIKMEGEIMNLGRVWSTVIACLCYCHFVSSSLPKGKQRLISLLPIFFIFTILPLYTTSAFFTSVTAFFITWLANFKLLLFAFDHGPFTSQPSISLPVFIITVALPFKIKPANALKKPKKLPLYLATEIPIAVLLVSVMYGYKGKIHPHIVKVVYCFLVFLVVDILVESSSSLVRTLFGLELEPPSDEPYLSTSLREFWGRRWNLTVNGILRETVHKPVRSACEAVMGGDWAAMPAMVATFLVSGLMHELLFWYIIRASPSWEMTMFFVVHGVCVVMELGLKVVLGRNEKRDGLPWFVSGPLTVGFVVATSFWLFFPPLMRNGVDVRVIEEFGYVGEVVKGKIVEFWLLIGRRQA
ncbi:hypothetical protein CASFOL_025685 [Castilleja foliolosa]|uniref:Wax synthase domain-containing protein n=1 Tax=Castilleja foliolosa TaxID=1961234 RepID=A0ABD3CTP9_9LAMI